MGSLELLVGSEVQLRDGLWGAKWDPGNGFPRPGNRGALKRNCSTNIMFMIGLLNNRLCCQQTSQQLLFLALNLSAIDLFCLALIKYWRVWYRASQNLTCFGQSPHTPHQRSSFPLFYSYKNMLLNVSLLKSTLWGATFTFFDFVKCSSAGFHPLRTVPCGVVRFNTYRFYQSKWCDEPWRLNGT